MIKDQFLQDSDPRPVSLVVASGSAVNPLLAWVYVYEVYGFKFQMDLFLILKTPIRLRYYRNTMDFVLGTS